MGRVKGSGEGAEREKRNLFFSPLPSPLSFFRPRTYRKGYYFYSPQSATVIKSKMATTTILRTRTRFRPLTNTPALQATQLPTLLVQQCWDLLRPCWHWCANGRNM